MSHYHVILHIGAPKCGSTYLQRILQKNQRTLRSLGVNYPHRNDGHPGNAAQVDRVTSDWLDQNLGDHHSLILSHEDLFALPNRGKRLASLCRKKGIRLQIVACLRPFEDWLVADYSQNIKQALTKKAGDDIPAFHNFIEQRAEKIKPTAFLRDWQSLTPDEPITVIPHDRLKQGMIDLCPHLAEADWTLPKWRANPSLTLAEAESIRVSVFNQKPQPRTDPLPQLSALFKPERQAIRRAYGLRL